MAMTLSPNAPPETRLARLAIHEPVAKHDARYQRQRGRCAERVLAEWEGFEPSIPV
jgi:hypothetical protein